MKIPEYITELIHTYIREKGKRPLPFNYDEWNSLQQYKEYLERELNKKASAE